MLPPRLIHPKERELYERSNNEDFLPCHNAKIGTIFHLFYILFHGYKLTFTMAIIGIFFLTLVFWSFLRSATNKRGIKNNVPTKQSLEHVKPSKPSTRQNRTPLPVIIPIWDCATKEYNAFHKS